MIDYETILPLARRLREQGHSYRTIGAKLGVAETTVNKWLTRPDFKPPVRYSDEDKARWAADADGTRTQAELATLWSINDVDVQTRLGMLRTSGFAACVKRDICPHKVTAKERYAELAKDIHEGITFAELATKWGVSVKGVCTIVYRMRDAGFDMTPVAEFGRRTVKYQKPAKRTVVAPPKASPPPAAKPRPKPAKPRQSKWALLAADITPDRTVEDIAELWGLSAGSTVTRLRTMIADGAVAAMPPFRPKPPTKTQAGEARRAQWAADADGTRTAEELAELWGITREQVWDRIRRLRNHGYDVSMKPTVPVKPPSRPAADITLWMRELDGTKTSAEICALWGVTLDTFCKRIRRLRDAGLYPEWLTPPRPKAERKPTHRLPPLWPRESTPAVAPPPEEHPRPVAPVGVALPPAMWSALGVANVLGMSWGVFAPAVHAALGWSLRPESLLSAEDAHEALALFGFAARRAA